MSNAECGGVAWPTARQDVLLNPDTNVVSDVAIDTSWQLLLIQIKTVCSHLQQKHEGIQTA